MDFPDALDAPTAHSQPRLPWSPNTHDPLMPLPVVGNQHDNGHESHNLHQRGHFDINRTLSGHQRRNREPSDVSVEALDLADYAPTVRPRQIGILLPGSPIPILPHDIYSRFPRSSPAPLSPSADSHRIPSLVSRGNTASTSTHSLTSSRRAVRRPYSFPETTHIQSTGSITHLSRGHGVDNALRNEGEIDITQFPPWSRNWYQSKNKDGISPKYDLDTPPPARINMFDPSFKPKPDYDNDFHPLPSYGNDVLPSRSAQSTSLREYHLPWSSDPLENGTPVNPETKEERVRMLEREFGQKAKPNARNPFTDENGKPLVGTVDSKGNIVTQGPRKRAALRALQIVLALVAAIPSIYAALIIKSKEGAPPPAGKAAAFVLYGLSVITTLGMLYLHLFHQCCSGRKAQKPFGENSILNGMMVLPVKGLPGGKEEKKKKGKKGGKNPGGGDVQVNLIVDPNAFGVGGSNEDRGSKDDDGWGSDRDTYTSHSRERRRRSPRRRSVFEGLAMEKEWKLARAWLKKMTAVDVAGLILWGGAFILILLGKRCPSGGYNGWCTAYNTSSAAACLLCIAFGVSIFFDVKDLFASKANPRTRT